MNQRQRLQMYLEYSPCSPIYGLFRTAALKRTLPILQANRRAGNASVFGGDLVFLAGFLRDHHMVFLTKPLLMLRGGGESHRPDSFRGLRHLIAEYWQFSRRLKQETRCNSWQDRPAIWWSRCKLMWRYLNWPPTLRLFEFHLMHALPLLQRIKAHRTAGQPAIRRLASRLAKLPSGSSIIIFGGGKHTKRNFLPLRSAIESRHTLTAICDDHPNRVTAFGETPVISPERLKSIGPAIILVSTDSYERMLTQRAHAVAQPDRKVWCIYDLSLECADSGMAPCHHRDFQSDLKSQEEADATDCLSLASTSASHSLIHSIES